MLKKILLVCFLIVICVPLYNYVYPVYADDDLPFIPFKPEDLQVPRPVDVQNTLLGVPGLSVYFKAFTTELLEFWDYNHQNEYYVAPDSPPVAVQLLDYTVVPNHSSIAMNYLPASDSFIPIGTSGRGGYIAAVPVAPHSSLVFVKIKLTPAEALNNDLLRQLSNDSFLSLLNHNECSASMMAYNRIAQGMFVDDYGEYTTDKEAGTAWLYFWTNTDVDTEMEGMWFGFRTDIRNTRGLWMLN